MLEVYLNSLLTGRSATLWCETGWKACVQKRSPAGTIK